MLAAAAILGTAALQSVSAADLSDSSSDALGTYTASSEITEEEADTEDSSAELDEEASSEESSDDDLSDEELSDDEAYYDDEDYDEDYDDYFDDDEEYLDESTFSSDNEYISSADVSDEWRYENDVLFREYIEESSEVSLTSSTQTAPASGTTAFGVTVPSIPSKLSGATSYSVIDISEYQAWNTAIDWASVKKSGISGAIIRVGYRGYGSSGQLVKDQYFDQNIKGALAAGVAVGVYFYTQAVSTTEAKAEADFVYNAIKSYDVTLPVYFDIEHVDYDTGRLDAANLSKSEQTALCTAFCDRLKSQGYATGVYASKYYFYDELNYEELQAKYEIWLAHYSSSTDYAGKIDVWQYSSSGVVSGIYGNVDLDLWFGTTPGKIASVSAKRVGSSVILSWSRSRGAFAFKIKKLNPDTNSYETVGYTRSTAFTVTDADYNETFMVTPYKRIGSDMFFGTGTSAYCEATAVVPTTITSASATANSAAIYLKNTGADVYKVWLSTDSSFSSGSTSYLRLEGKTTASFTGIDGNNTVFYVKTQACKKKSGTWYYSTTKTTKVYPTTLVDMPSVYSFSASSDSLTVQLSNNSGNKFDVWICSDNTFASGKTRYTSLSGKSTVTFENLVNAGGTYYVKARSLKVIDGVTYYSDYVVQSASLLSPVEPSKISWAQTTDSSVTLGLSGSGADVQKVWICGDETFAASKTRYVRLEGKSTVSFTGLSNKGGTYYVKTQACKKTNGTWKYSEEEVKEITLSTPVSAPDVSSLTVTSSSVKVSLSSGNADVQKIWICGDKSFDGNKTRYVRLEGKNEVTFSALNNKGGTYYVKTQACKKLNGVWYYSDTDVKTVKLYSDDSAEAFSSVKLTSSSAYVTLANTGADVYKLWISSDEAFSDGSTRYVRLEGTRTADFSKLVNDGGKYYLKAQSCSLENGKWSYSDPVTAEVTLLSGVSASIDSTSVSESSIKLTLTGTGDVYKVWLCTDESFDDDKTTYLRVENSTTARFTSLSETDDYYIRLQACKKVNGEWKYSDLVYSTAKLLTSAKAVTPDTIKTTTSTVKVTLTDTKATSYEVWICGDTSFASGKTRYVKLTGTASVNFKSLANPGGKYYLKLRALYTANGVTVYSDEIITSFTLCTATTSVTTSGIVASSNSASVTLNNTAADVYKVWISADSSFPSSGTRYVRLDGSRQVSFYSLANSGGTYYIRVQGCKYASGSWHYSPMTIKTITLM